MIIIALHPVLHHIITILLLFNSIYQVSPLISTEQYIALTDLYNNTNGDNWNNKDYWFQYDPCDYEWNGVYCNYNYTIITSIILSSNGLNGTIPASIGTLFGLTQIELDRNSIGGTIPDSIGNIVALSYLSLYNNQLGGKLPDSIGNLTAMTYLTLNNNQLNGTLPSAIGDLVLLQSLNLRNNHISGTLPDSIGNLSVLYYLDVGNNNFSGIIPASISKFTLLNTLYIDSNQFSGSIPSMMGFLETLIYLDLFSTQMCGGCFPWNYTIYDCNVTGIPFNCSCPYLPCYSNCTEHYNCSSSEPLAPDPLPVPLPTPLPNPLPTPLPVPLPTPLPISTPLPTPLNVIKCNQFLPSTQARQNQYCLSLVPYSLTLNYGNFITNISSFSFFALHLNFSDLFLQTNTQFTNCDIYFLGVSQISSSGSLTMTNSNIYLDPSYPRFNISGCIYLNNVTFYLQLPASLANNPFLVISSACHRSNGTKWILTDSQCYSVSVNDNYKLGIMVLFLRNDNCNGMDNTKVIIGCVVGALGFALVVGVIVFVYRLKMLDVNLKKFRVRTGGTEQAELKQT